MVGSEDSGLDSGGRVRDSGFQGRGPSQVVEYYYLKYHFNTIHIVCTWKVQTALRITS